MVIIPIVFICIFIGIVNGIKRLEYTIGSLLNNNLAVDYEKYEVANDEVKEINNRAIDYSQHLNQIIVKFQDAASGLKSIASELKENAHFTNQTCYYI